MLIAASIAAANERRRTVDVHGQEYLLCAVSVPISGEIRQLVGTKTAAQTRFRLAPE